MDKKQSKSDGRGIEGFFTSKEASSASAIVENLHLGGGILLFVAGENIQRCFCCYNSQEECRQEEDKYPTTKE